MKNLIPLMIVATTLISGCDKPPQSRKEKTSDPLLAYLEKKVDTAYRGMPYLAFKADLTRQVGGKDQISYVASVKMTWGQVMTSIYLPGPESLRVAKVIGLIGEKPEITDVFGDGTMDSCLFGSLTVSWVGPDGIAERPYTGRIRGGHLCEIIHVDDSPCYQIGYEHGDKVVEVYYVDTQTSLLRRWVSFHYNLESEGGKLWMPWMVVTRKYQYREPEPAVLSAESETLKGEGP